MDRAQIKKGDPAFGQGASPVGTAAPKPSTAAPAPEATPGRAPRVGTAGHAILFAETKDRTCDICGAALGDADRDVDPIEPFAPSGTGMYLWSRGDTVIREEVPLCADCGVAVGVTAMSRWQSEEEEG